MKRLLIAAMAAALWLLPVVAEAQVKWPMYQANAAHTGYIPVSFDPDDFVLDWEVVLSPEGENVNPVAAVDGRVFATLRNIFDNGRDDFYALDVTDGHVLWSKDFGNVFSVNPPAYDAGKVYLQVGNHASDTHLYTYNAVSGALLNNGPHAAQWDRYYAPTIVGGTAYINGGSYGGMYAFNFFEEPDQRWFKSLEGYDEWTPAVDGIHAYAYVGGKLSVVWCAYGTEHFSIDDPNFEWWGWSMDLAPVLGGRNDVLVVQDQRLISFDLGERDIRYEIADGFGRSRNNPNSGQPSVAGGVVYVINHGNLEARNQDDGAFLWSWIPGGDFRVEGTLIITNSHALVVTVDDVIGVTPGYGSAIHAIDLVTHQSDWSYAFPESTFWEGAVSGDLAWSEGRLYFARDDGVLTVFRLIEPYGQSSIVEFETTSYVVAENAGTATVTLRRTGSGEGAVTATVISEDGTATAGADYGAVNQMVSWANGDTAAKTVQVTIQNDAATEGLEYFSLLIGTVTGAATAGVFNRAQVTILDDETNILRFSSSGTDVSEAGGTISLYVVREGPSAGAVSVHYATANGTAMAGSDYSAVSGTLYWVDGDASPKPITVTILNDLVKEDDEAFSVALSEPQGAALVGQPAVFSVTVIDDDGPRLQFSTKSYKAPETASSVDLTIKRLGIAEGPVSVDWTTGNGTATAGQDYGADSGTLEWADADSSDRIITITILDDAAVEGGEVFHVTLSNPVGNTALGQPSQANVSIADDEAAEFLIPTTTSLGQTRPRVAMNAAGSTVVVWDSWKEDGWGWGVYGQRFDGDADPAGGAFRVNQSTDENQMDGAVAMAADGSFVVAWEAEITGGPRIHARRFNASSTPIGNQFVVNTSASGTQTDPRIAVDGAGRFMVVWTGRDASGFGAFGRMFAADGTPAGNEVALNTHTYLSQHSPAVAGFPGGGFVTVWESYGQEDYDSDGVFAQRFNAAGSPVGAEFRVNTTTEGDQSAPAVAAVGSGAFLVVWEDATGLDGAFGSIRGQWFDASASPVGNEFQVNNYSAGDQGRPTAAADTLGRAVVLWEGRSNQDGSAAGVFGRVLFDDGTFATGEIQYNTYTSRFPGPAGCRLLERRQPDGGMVQRTAGRLRRRSLRRLVAAAGGAGDLHGRFRVGEHGGLVGVSSLRASSSPGCGRRGRRRRCQPRTGGRPRRRWNRVGRRRSPGG